MSGRKSEWVDGLLNLGVLGVADALGLETTTHGAKTRMICPSCNQRTRHAKRRDRRASAEVVKNGDGFVCYGSECGAKGSAVDVLSFWEAGDKYKQLPTWQQNRIRGAAMRLLGGVPDEDRYTPRPAPPEPEPVYPCKTEVDALWIASQPMSEVPHAMAWLDRQGCDSSRTVASDMVRVLPEFVVIPRWATNWRATGNKMLFRMVDFYGETRSMEGRRSFTAKEGAKACGASLPKEDNVVLNRLGLVFACPNAQKALALGALSGRVHWYEGPKKTLQGWLDDPTGIHIGVVSGSVKPALLHRFGPECQHEIRTDPDSAGAGYATEIVRSMSAEQRRKGVRLPKYMQAKVTHDGVTIKLLEGTKDDNGKLASGNGSRGWVCSDSVPGEDLHERVLAEENGRGLPVRASACSG